MQHSSVITLKRENMKNIHQTTKRAMISILLTLLLTTFLHTAPIINEPLVLTQPDGAVISAFESGDEFHNWVHDENGYAIIRDATTNQWCLAIMEL